MAAVFGSRERLEKESLRGRASRVMGELKSSEKQEKGRRKHGGRRDRRGGAAAAAEIDL